MSRRSQSLAVAFALGAALSAACGSGDTAEDELRRAIAAAGARPLEAPAAERPELVALGRALYFDKILSGNRNISCATCHTPSAGTGDNLPLSLGEGARGSAEQRELGGGHFIPRNAPPVWNAGLTEVTSMFWDSRIEFDRVNGALTTPDPRLNGIFPELEEYAAVLDSALAAQAMFPVTSAHEMRGGPGSNELADATDNVAIWEGLMARLVGVGNGTVGGLEGYRVLFSAAYPEVASFDDLNFAHAARAIAAFERTAFLALGSRFDQYLAGDNEALTGREKAGARLFYGRAACSSCHSGPLLTDLQHHALCVPQLGPGKEPTGDDRGRSLITGRPFEDYRFRTPPLRNVAITGPWMHDGAFTTLEGAVRHHLDPVTSLMNYDPAQLRSDFVPLLDRDAGREAARQTALSPALATPIALGDREVDDLVAFLHALTDPASLSRFDVVPPSVPSGLPVAD